MKLVNGLFNILKETKMEGDKKMSTLFTDRLMETSGANLECLFGASVCKRNW